MTRTATLFADITTAAMQLDPAELRATLLATHDRLPGGTRSSETGVRAPRMEVCTDPSCPEGDWWDDDAATWAHSHPIPNDPTGDAAMRPSRSEADLRTLDYYVARYITAVDWIARRCHSGPFPTDWRTAALGAQRLVRDDMLPALEQTWGAKDVSRWVMAAGDAVHDIELIACRHLPRQASEWEQHWTSGLADEDCCRVHLRLEPPQRTEVKAKGLCQQCGRLKADAADILGCDFDQAPDPPRELLETYRRINNPSGPAWKAERSKWLQTLEKERRCA